MVDECQAYFFSDTAPFITAVHLATGPKVKGLQKFEHLSYTLYP